MSRPVRNVRVSWHCQDPGSLDPAPAPEPGRPCRVGVYDLFADPLPRVYLSIAKLDSPPCHVWHEGGVVLLTCDPDATRLEITTWCVDHLEREEWDALCVGWGYEVGQPVPDWTCDDEPAHLYVPPALRLPGAPAIQGGRALSARRKANNIDREWSAYMNELRATARRGA